MRLTRVLREGFWGSAVFWGASSPTQVVIEFSRVVGYTMIHTSAFVVLGVVAELKKHPLGATQD